MDLLPSQIWGNITWSCCLSRIFLQVVISPMDQWKSHSLYQIIFACLESSYCGSIHVLCASLILNYPHVGTLCQRPFWMTIASPLQSDIAVLLAIFCGGRTQFCPNQSLTLICLTVLDTTDKSGSWFMSCALKRGSLYCVKFTHLHWERKQRCLG